MNGVISYHKTLDSRSKEDILNLAMNCYSFVGVFTFKKWAQKIKETYCLSEPRNKAIYNTIIDFDGEISHSRHGRTSMRYKKQSK